jgi:hypothetical protein
MKHRIPDKSTRFSEAQAQLWCLAAREPFADLERGGIVLGQVVDGTMTYLIENKIGGASRRRPAARSQ